MRASARLTSATSVPGLRGGLSVAIDSPWSFAWTRRIVPSTGKDRSHDRPLLDVPSLGASIEVEAVS